VESPVQVSLPLLLPNLNSLRCYFYDPLSKPLMLLKSNILFLPLNSKSHKKGLEPILLNIVNTC